MGRAERKPLLVRGARQVGKSSAIRNPGAAFEHFLEINFELDQEAKVIFTAHREPGLIIERLSLLYQFPVKQGKTLLFFR